MNFFPNSATKLTSSNGTSPKSQNHPEHLTITHRTQENLKKINELVHKASSQIKSQPAPKSPKFPVNSNKIIEDNKFIEKQAHQALQNSYLSESINNLFKKYNQSKTIQDSLGPLPEYLQLVESNNLTEALLLSLDLNKFLCSQLQGPPDEENEDNDLSQLMLTTKQLESQISSQKQKISSICKNLDTSLEKSKTFLSSFESSFSPQSFSQKE